MKDLEKFIKKREAYYKLLNAHRELEDSYEI